MAAAIAGNVAGSTASTSETDPEITAADQGGLNAV